MLRFGSGKERRKFLRASARYQRKAGYITEHSKTGSTAENKMFRKTRTLRDNLTTRSFMKAIREGIFQTGIVATLWAFEHQKPLIGVLKLSSIRLLAM
jgi:hypothetical protein